jgi:hypothetical protein
MFNEVRLNVFMLSDIIQSLNMLSDIILSLNILNVIMLSVNMLNGAMLVSWHPSHPSIKNFQIIEASEPPH